MYISNVIVSSILFVVSITVLSVEGRQTFKCRNNYCEYQVGDVGTRIIISAPHGGDIKPSDIPNRSSGCFVNNACVWRHDCGIKNKRMCKGSVLKDVYTRELAILLADELQALHGVRPHLIINHLHRSKLDGNREVEQATFGNKKAAIGYKMFHAFVNFAKKGISNNVGRGLYIDMHGQTHSEGWVELGYLLTKKQLNVNELSSTYSSIKNLATMSNFTFEAILRGGKSLGKFLQDEGIKVVPSPQYISPGTNGNYYPGGYNTKVHGSKHGGVIDAIQIETPKIYRHARTAPLYVKLFASALTKFMNEHY